ncbi:MAG TPA: response regulator [Polyangiaceae bacterium]|nr:response regulator [Polyangiaceae bacterium]
MIEISMPDQPATAVLAVDDRPANLVVLDALLDGLDVRVVRAASGEEALLAAESQEFALILLDLYLPGIDGLETARQLRKLEQSRSVPIIFLTAFDQVEDEVQQAYALGAVDFLFKPIVAPILVSKVAVFVDLHRKTKAIQRQERMLREAQEREYQQSLSQERARWEADQLRREVDFHRSVAAAREQQAVTLRSIRDAVVATDAAGRVTLLNRAAEELSGWSSAEALGVNRELVVPLRDPETHEPRGPFRVEGDSLLIARDGKEYRVTDSLAPIVDDRGISQGTVLVFRDVTAQRGMEQALQKSQRLESLGHLAAGIAHDFNNMLSVIMASSSLADQHLPENSPAHELLSDIESTCERATGLTRQLLTFARGGSPVRKLTEVARLIREAVGLSLRGSGTECTFDLDPHLWPAQIDITQITQVLSNLAINARDAMHDQGSINVRAQNVRSVDGNLPLDPGDYLEIAVEDSGVGIAPAQLEAIFDPYFSTKPGHHGLGLASAYSIVSRHGGLLRVDSKPGEKTTFFVYLRASPGSPIEEPAPVSEHYGGGGHILVMDDEPLLRDLLVDSLSALECKVEGAAHGDDAIALYRAAMERSDPFDVVILDLTVRGGKGGAETLRELQAIDPNVRAIACSGYANDPIMCDHAAFGFADALEKPFRFAMLARVVRRLMARKPPSQAQVG